MVDSFKEILQYTCQHMEVASDSMKARYALQGDSAGFRERDLVRLYRSRRTVYRSSREGPYKVLCRINGSVYRIKRNTSEKKLFVDLERLASYREAVQDAQP